MDANPFGDNELLYGARATDVEDGATPVLGWSTLTVEFVVDECGAPARFTGSTITPLAHVDGKLRPEAVTPFLDWLGTEHHPQPAVLSISQSSEMGTVYSVDEIAELCDVAHRAGMRVHVDGARIANAVVATGSDLRSLLLEPGVDVLTFGLTKNGAMYGEAVVYLKPELATAAKFVRKQAGQLPSKARFVAAQISALLTDDLWLRNARHANDQAAALARRLDGVAGVSVPRAPEVNAVFAQVPRDQIEALQDWSFFWEWDLSASLVRWMTSFATTDDDIERFATGVAAILG